MAVPTSYRFIKESNGNVLVNAYEGVTLLGIVASLNPAKSLSINDSQPTQVVIPIDLVVAHSNSRFLSIPFAKIDLANSTPANTNPTSASDAIDKLQTDFFFDVGGSGPGGQNLQQVTDIGSDTNNAIQFTDSNGNAVVIGSTGSEGYVAISNTVSAGTVTITGDSLPAGDYIYQLSAASGYIGVITGPINTDPTDGTANLKVPFSRPDGTIIYLLASTNND